MHDSSPSHGGRKPSNQLTQAERWDLVLSVYPMIWDFAQHCLPLNNERNIDVREMFVQQCVLAVYRGAELYDGRAKFTTYAYWWMRSSWARFRSKEMQSLVRERTNFGETQRENGELTRQLETIAAYDPRREERDRVEWTESEWQDVLRVLPGRDREIISLRFRRGLTLDQAGEVIGVTRERARQIESRALERLRLLFVSRQIVHGRRTK